MLKKNTVLQEAYRVARVCVFFLLSFVASWCYRVIFWKADEGVPIILRDDQ